MHATEKPQTPFARCRSVIGFDAEWQFPAITEKHAFTQACRLLPVVPTAVYFGFPWATLVDILNTKGKSAAAPLLSVLESAKPLLQDYTRVVTTCQHILMLKFEDLLASVGISHVFWTHAVKDQTHLPGHEHIAISPFPLYPVQAIGIETPNDRPRKHLFSFVGAKGNQWYLTRAREMIIDHLSSDNRGLVIPREQWHFQKVVYDHQIHARATGPGDLVDTTAGNEFTRILHESTFSLCPSGSGPNSIRLWESIGLGAIPVVLSERYLPPGNPALWEQATVSCPETLDAIRALPDRLAALAQDEQQVENKRKALRQLWMLYGPDCFVYDIQKTFTAHAGACAEPTSPTAASYARLHHLANQICAETPIDETTLAVFLLGCSTRLLTNPPEFLAEYEKSDGLRAAYQRAMATDDASQRVAMSRALAHTGATLG